MPYHTRTYLIVLISSIFWYPAFGQVVHKNKTVLDSQNEKTKNKDTTIYKIILSDKDTAVFGSNKKNTITEKDHSLIGIFERKENIILIQYMEAGKKVLSIQAGIKEIKKDTVQVFSPDFVTELDFLKFQITFYCDIRSIQVNDYNSATSYIFIRRIIYKLFL